MSPTTAHPAGDDALTASSLPLFFEIGDFSELDCSLPDDRHGQSLRVWARSLTVWQKEAMVYSARSGKAWRLASDEGPYLQGHDAGPCPLSFLTTGMISSYMNEIAAALAQQDVTVRDLSLVQHNRYAMEGSALAGTMRGSAQPVELEVLIDCDADDGRLEKILAVAVRASPIDALTRGAHASLFTLTHNGRSLPAGRVADLNRPAPSAPRAMLDRIRPATAGDPGWIRKLAATAAVQGGAAAGLQAEQKRMVHLRATCRLLADGVKEIVQEMDRPAGSTFRFLSDESREFGGASRAPDAASYASAGLAFCFMTQLGRYATILKKDLHSYDVIQDTYFSAGGASGRTGRPGACDPVETHLYLGSNEDDAFAQACLEMGEQTCYLHAFCRTALHTNVTVRRST